MPNPHRGEISVTLDGRRHVLCLTLGALAELEAALGAGDLVALAERFGSGRLSSRDLLTILAAGLRGGGSPLDAESIAALPLTEGIAPVANAVADLLVATFGSAPANPPAAPAEAPP